MGGEPTKALALAVMRAAATNFFNLKTEIPSLEARRIHQWHAELSRYRANLMQPQQNNLRWILIPQKFVWKVTKSWVLTRDGMHQDCTMRKSADNMRILRV